MKKIAILALSSLALCLTACAGTTEPKNNVKTVNEIAPYPAAKSGFVRSVIYLPELKDEQNAKVELLIGKEMVVDCNAHSLSGSVKQEELKGWGYQYVTVDKVNSGISTLMACPPNDEKKTDFVTINHNLGLMKYNSQLPIVVYTPKDIQVKYRVWSAGQLQTASFE